MDFKSNWFSLMYLDGMVFPQNSDNSCYIWFIGYFSSYLSRNSSGKDFKSAVCGDFVDLPLRSLTKHLIVKSDVKLVPYRFRPTFMPFKREWRKSN